MDDDEREEQSPGPEEPKPDEPESTSADRDDPLVYPAELQAAAREAIREMFSPENLRRAAYEATQDAFKPENIRAAAYEATREALKPANIRAAMERAVREAFDPANLDASIWRATRDIDPETLRRAAASFRSISKAELLGVWREASELSDETPATESLFDRLQVDVPSLPPAVLRWLVMAWVWLTLMGLLSAEAIKNPTASKDFIVYTGLSPFAVSTALAVWSGRAVKRWQERGGKDETAA